VKLLKRFNFLLRISHSRNIARRYFVVNGFDGVLTIMGLLLGFIMSDTTDASVILSACLGATIALGVSGVSSAYVSESAERQHDLNDLQDAMLDNLKNSEHAVAAKWSPIFIAVINGSAPVVFAFIIMIPILLDYLNYSLPYSPLYLSLAIAVSIIFLLGSFLGSIAGTSWLVSGVKTLIIAVITFVLIVFVLGVIH